MPFDGSGNFTRSYNFVQDKTNGIKILASRMDGEFDNYASALNQTFLRNGVAAMTGNLNMGANSINSLGSGTVNVPAVRFNADPTSGIYMAGYGIVALTSLGLERLQANSTGVVVTGTLSTSGAATFNGQTQINNTLGVTGATTLGNASVGGTLGVTGATTLNGTLGVTGATTLNGTVSVNNQFTATGTAFLGGTVNTGTGVSTGVANIELGGSRTGDGISFLDFHSVAATDFEARILRGAGVNGIFQLVQTGSGTFSLEATGGGIIQLANNTVERFQTNSTGALVSGTFGVSGAATFNSATQVNSTFGVSGTATFGTANITQANITTNSVSGNATVGGTFGVTGTSAFQGATTVNGTLQVNNTFTVTGQGNFGANISSGTGVSTGDVVIELGGNRTGSGNVYIDFHAVNSTDYEARFIRDAGVNGDLRIAQTGSGALNVVHEGTGNIGFRTGGIDRGRVYSGGGWQFGDTFGASPGAFVNIGDGAFDGINYGRSLQIVTGAGRRQQAAFIRAGNNVLSVGYNGATAVWGFGAGQVTDSLFAPNYLAFDMTNSRIGIGTTTPQAKLDVVENGSSQSLIMARNANLNMQLRVDSSAGVVGTGTSHPLIFIVNAAEVARFDTANNLGIGPASSIDAKMTVQETGTCQITLKNSAGVTQGFIGTIGAIGAAQTNALRIRGEAGISFGIAGAHNLQINSSGQIIEVAQNAELGFKDLPQNAQAGAYTLVLADRGKHIYATGGAEAVTIPPNSSVAFPIGTAVTVVNDGSGARTLTQGAGVTLKQAGTGTAGNRTLAVGGIATLLKVGTDTWYVSGVGVT